MLCFNKPEIIWYNDENNFIITAVVYKPKEFFMFSESPVLILQHCQVHVAGWPEIMKVVSF